VILDVIDRHLLARLEGGRALIDTGAPFDIGRGKTTSLLGARWTPPAEHAAVLDAAQAHLGVDIEWLIGFPTLRRCRVLLDWRAGEVRFERDPIAIGGIRHAITLDDPVPRIDVTCDGRIASAVLDSGAALSYVPRDVVAKRTPIRRERDFHPSIGAFDVDVWALPISVGDRAIALEAGVLPSPLDRMLVGGGWILGSDFFRDRAIVLDYPDRTVLDAEKA
jgi:hypothetical protein